MEKKYSFETVVTVNFQLPVEEALPLLEELVEKCRQAVGKGRMNCAQLADFIKEIYTGDGQYCLGDFPELHGNIWGSFTPTQEQLNALEKAIREGSKIWMIKAVREITHCGLREAKEFVESCMPRPYG
jgi:hypothetical protein